MIKPGDSVRPVSEDNNSVWRVTAVSLDRDRIEAEIQRQYLKPDEESRTAWGSSIHFVPVPVEEES